MECLRRSLCSGVAEGDLQWSVCEGGFAAEDLRWRMCVGERLQVEDLVGRGFVVG